MRDIFIDNFRNGIESEGPYSSMLGSDAIIVEKKFVFFIFEYGLFSRIPGKGIGRRACFSLTVMLRYRFL